MDISGSMYQVFYEMQDSVRSFVISTGSGTRQGWSIISSVFWHERFFTTDKRSMAKSCVMGKILFFREISFENPA